MNTTIRKIGNSEGVIIPKEMLERHALAAGDKVDVIETAKGLMLVKAESDFAEQMRYAREAMHKYRDALRELAK